LAPVIAADGVRGSTAVAGLGHLLVEFVDHDGGLAAPAGAEVVFEQFDKHGVPNPQQSCSSITAVTV